MRNGSAAWLWTKLGALVAVMALSCRPVAAEWQLKPFLGVAFGGDTTFSSAEVRPKLGFGTSAVLVGEFAGIEADVERVPGLFRDLVAPDVATSAVTLTGNAILALPRRLTQYTLRPYAAVGGGLMRAHIDRFPPAEGLKVASTLPAIDVGGGVTGFLTDRIGLSWDLRWFRSVAGSARGLSSGDEQVSFWRGYMAVAIRLTRSTR